jgi:DNA polymerase III alpha subunit (gram-positive type)
LPTHRFSPIARNAEDYTFTPSSDGPAKRAAVVFDCEMVGVNGGHSEAVRFSAVDFLTGEVLVDTFVVPETEVTSWRTTVSGVTKGLLADMVRQRRTLNGWKEARQALWSHIDETTILIGQALSNDLDVLRMIHLKIVDTAILTKEAVEPNCSRAWGLKTLCQELLSKDVQGSASGHCCLEDSFAAREVVLWCLRHPDRLETWAGVQRALIQKMRAEREAEKHSRISKKLGNISTESTKLPPTLDSFLDDGDEYYLDDDGYPVDDDFDDDLSDILLFPGRSRLSLWP